MSSTTLYLKDEENVAICPGDNGFFNLNDVAARHQYEVQGVGEDTGPLDQADHPIPRTTSSGGRGGQSFTFHRPSSSFGSAAALRPAATTANLAKPFLK